MDFQNPLFLIPVIVGPIFIIAGFVLLKFPSKRINWLYGYRTTSSMKTQERWDFSQRFSALEMIKWGGLLTLTSVLGLIFDLNEKTGTIIGLGLMLLFVILLVARTEKAIKKNFGKE